jgi:hypothetical protein
VFVITWQWGKPACIKSETNVFQACLKFRLYAERQSVLLFFPQNWGLDEGKEKDMLAFIRATPIHLNAERLGLIYLYKIYLTPEAYKKEIKVVESDNSGFNSRFGSYKGQGC